MVSARAGFGKIRREHVEQACTELLRDGVQGGGGSYFVAYNGAELPAKRVLRTAFRIANGVEIPASAFSGGQFTARILEAIGIKVTVRSDATPG